MISPLTAKPLRSSFSSSRCGGRTASQHSRFSTCTNLSKIWLCSKAALVLCALVLFSLYATPAHAVVDLLNPVDQNSTNATTVTFEFYASLQDLSACSLNVGGNNFAVQTPQSNAMNHVQVQNIIPGTYLWNISCTSTTQPGETSVTRTLTIDTVAPTLVVFSPQGGTLKNIPLDIIPNDETASTLSCTTDWNGQRIDAFNVLRNTHYARNYTGTVGSGTLLITCADAAGNTVSQTKNLTIIPDFNLILRTEKTEYGLGEPVRLTIDAISGANVSVDICPDQPGFVQCTTALIGSNIYPQTFTLPYMNKTGQYIIEGIATYGGQTKANQTRYTLTNTISAGITLSATPKINQTINLTASVGGGIAPYRLAWTLHNGTIIRDVSTASVTFPAANTYTEYLTVYDQANNTRTVNTSIIVYPAYSLTVLVKDNATGEPIANADVDLGGQKTKTIQGGYAYLVVDQGVYQIFVSADSYRFGITEVYVNASQTITVGLSRDVQDAPTVTIIAPASNSTTTSPFAVKYTVSHNQPVTCTLFFGDETSNWFTANGTQDVNDNNVHEFTRDLVLGTHKTRVECKDAQGHTGTSSIVTFSVALNNEQTQNTPAAETTVAPTADEARLQAIADGIDDILKNMDGYGQKEKEAIALLGFDKNLRNTRRAVLQAIRDSNDLQYRKELDDAGKQAEHKRLVDSAIAAYSATPIGLTVTDSKQFVKYLKESETDNVATALAGLGGMSADPNSIKTHLMADQQKFTVSTKAIQVEYLYPDRTTKSITAVTRSFTYAKNIEPEYQVYEVIPKEVAKSARELTIFTKVEVLKDDPVLRFNREETVSYVFPRRVDFVRLEQISTIIAKPYAQDTTLLSGAVLGFGGDLLGLPSYLIVLIVLIVLAYLFYYFDIVKQVKYLAYRFGKHEKDHYLRVMINDAMANLDAGNYDKATMLYKEIRLTYDTLPVPAKNELYEDVVELVKRMDVYYFNMVMMEMDSHIKAGNMEAAIAAYEKLTGTFERLDQEHQNQLVTAVSAMARRLGVGVHV